MPCDPVGSGDGPTNRECDTQRFSCNLSEASHGLQEYAESTQTAFPMKANLPKREPDILKKWESEEIYSTFLQAGKGRAKYILHDGPPYANGHIHLGTALNKILKDMIVKSKFMAGFDSD